MEQPCQNIQCQLCVQELTLTVYPGMAELLRWNPESIG